MASLAEIFGAITEADQVKEAQAAEAEGVLLVDDDTMEKAAHYDAIGRRLAQQVFAEVEEDPELMKEAMGGQMYGAGEGGKGGLPAAFAAAAKGGAKGEDDDEDEKKKKAKKKDDDDDDSSMEEKMEEKKAAVLQAMNEDEAYLNYILDKYVYAEPE